MSGKILTVYSYAILGIKHKPTRANGLYGFLHYLEAHHTLRCPHERLQLRQITVAF